MATTYQDTNVDTLRINKLTKQEYDNLSEHSSTELYLVPEEVDSVVTENSTNPVQSGAVFNAIADIHSTAPLGAILPYASSTIPSCWMLCDGSAISRTDYAELFSLIGTAYGSGDGSTTFNIPDLRETLPIGAGTSTRAAIAAHDSYNVGEFKDDQLQDHSHKYLTGNAEGSSGATLCRGNQDSINYNQKDAIKYASDDTNIRTGTTTHGKQLGVNYIIRVLKGSTETNETPINYNNIPIVFSEASTKANVQSGDSLATLFGKIQKWNNTPLRDTWGYIATLQSSQSQDTSTSFVVNKAGFFQLIIQGTSLAVNAVARINYPNNSTYNGTSACSATMLNGFGVGNMCYLLPGTYTLEAMQTSGTVVTCNVIKMNDNTAPV